MDRCLPLYARTDPKTLHQNLWWPDRHWAVVLSATTAAGSSSSRTRPSRSTSVPRYGSPISSLPSSMKGRDSVRVSNCRRRWEALEDGKLYRIRVPKVSPAKQFWSINVYDNATWGFIMNPQIDPIGNLRQGQDESKRRRELRPSTSAPKLPTRLECNWVRARTRTPSSGCRCTGRMSRSGRRPSRCPTSNW